MGAPRFTVAAAVVAALWGCGFHGQRADLSQSLAPTQPAAVLSDGTTKIPYQELFQYTVGNGDEIDIEVAGHSEFSGHAVIDQRGRLPVPNSTRVIDVAGLMICEVEGRITQEISAFCVGKPDVHVSLFASRSKFYYVLGGVAYPGLYRMDGSIVRLREAIAAAGLFREYRADQRRIGIITPDPVKPTYTIVSAYDAFRGEDRQNVIIKPGDIVLVQDRIIYDLDGFLYALFRETQDVSSTNRAVKFWQDAVSEGKFGNFTAPSPGATLIY